LAEVETSPVTQQLEEREIVDARDVETLRIEPSPRWVRAFFGGQPIADSKHVLLVLEPRRLPVYFFPMRDVRMDLLRQSDYSASSGGTNSSRMRWTLESVGRTVPNVGWSYPEPDAAHAQLKDHVAFYWDKLDAWFEEDQEVYVHPRDPYKRVDVMASSRHVKVVVDDEVIAETNRPHLLFETGLPTRYYIPAVDVRLDLLEKTDTTTQCPYKGRAVYWSIRAGGKVHQDLVWSYPFPIPECTKIAQLMAFYNEKLDIYVDGELQARPKTNWS
jgi:uncharacterized protein (DUF427 family)